MIAEPHNCQDKNALASKKICLASLEFRPVQEATTLPTLLTSQTLQAVQALLQLGKSNNVFAGAH